MKKIYLKAIFLFVISNIFLLSNKFNRSVSQQYIIVVLLIIYIAILISLFDIGNILSSSVYFDKKLVKFLLPAIIEFTIFIIIPILYYLIVNKGNYNLGDGLAIYSLKQFIIAAEEELITSFTWVYVGMLLLVKIKSDKKKNNIILFAVSLLFMFCHISNAIKFVELKAITSKWENVLWITLYLLNIFSVGLYIKVVFIKTKSIICSILIHFIINLSRGMSPVFQSNISPIILFSISVFYLIAFYIFKTKDYISVKWNVMETQNE